MQYINSMATSHKELPSLETCLFGVSGKCPKVNTGTATKKGKSLFDKKISHDNDSNKTTADGPSLSSFLENNMTSPQNDDDIDSLLENDRWQQPHDIDLVVLRKLASQGVPEEGSWRGLVWRILLGYLPSEDIHHTWKETLPPQRHFYRTLVDQYLYKTVDDEQQDVVHHHSTLDSGRELRGQLSKTLHRDRQLRKNYNRVGRLDDSMNDAGDWSEREGQDLNDDDDDDDDDDGGATIMSEWTLQTKQLSAGATTNRHKSSLLRSSAARRRSSSQMNATQRIQRQLPEKYQELWKQAGIVLDKSESAAALGLNQLRIPQELLVLKRKETHQNQKSDQHIPDDGGSENDAMSESNEQKKERDDTAQLNEAERTEQVFQQFLQDAKTLSEIRKDVVRTHPDLRFYLEPQDSLGIRRYAALERILFVWAKLNKGVRYVQGMNEIAATLYYVLANDLNVDFAVYAEADTYYLFHTLMSGSDMMRDVFVADLDDSTCGIQGRIANMQALLERHDPELFLHLEEVGMDPSFYAIRWLTTLLSREFLLPDTIRLWDSMFSSTHKENFLRYACGTMVMKVRDDLIKGDFSRCLRLLQSYPTTNLDDILEASRGLWIYESQITLACHRGGITLNQALHHIQPPPGIIMAFGLKGGMAPSLTDQIQDAANAVQEQVEQTTTGLFSRAKRFLRKESGSDTAGDAANADTAEEKQNGEEQEHDEQQKDVPAADKDKLNRTEIAKTEAAPGTSLRQKFWKAWGNRGTGKPAPPMEPVEEKAAEESEARASLSILPRKPRAWNRGRTESYGKAPTQEEPKRTPII